MNTPKNVTRILRASISRVSGSVMEELFAARERACASQKIDGLSGSLMYSSGWFVLWLEGSDEAVDSMLKRSAKHACHTQPRVIHRSRGPATLKESLTIATTQWPESAADFARRIDTVSKADPALDPREIWRRLSEPCTLETTQPPRRVALVGADDTRSMDLVRKIADRFRAPMVYQRFASSDLTTRDVGAAYVDLPIEGDPTRVQVLSRRALAHRMVRDSLKGVEKLAVLLGPRPSSAIELADSVGGYVHAEADTPEIDLVGECPEVAHSISEYLRTKFSRATPGRVAEATESRLYEILFGAPRQQPA